MADISKEELKSEIEKILKKSKLKDTTTKKVIQQLEKNLGVELSDQKKLIDKLVMQYVNELESESDASEPEKEAESEDEESEEEKPAKRRKVEEKKKKAAKPKGKKAGGGGGGAGKGSGYTRAYKLSPALAALVGADEMPRHEVVKKVWAIVKERNLYDPSNKQFAICDEPLHKVIGTQRFRIFGMMKYLKNHFTD